MQNALKGALTAEYDSTMRLLNMNVGSTSCDCARGISRKTDEMFTLVVLHISQVRHCQSSAIVWYLLQPCVPYYLTGSWIASIGLSSDLHKVFHVKKLGWYIVAFPGTITVLLL